MGKPPCAALPRFFCRAIAKNCLTRATGSNILLSTASHSGRHREGKTMSLEEALFTTLVIVGVTATILAASALIADYFFPETPRQARLTHRAQATYRRPK
jgi:hypothetical protein